MFLSRNKKNNVYPCKPQFFYIKVGFKGVKIYRSVFVMCFKVVDLQRKKQYLRICESIEDSDQSVHSSSLIRVFPGHILDSHGCKVFSCGQVRLTRYRECAG